MLVLSRESFVERGQIALFLDQLLQLHSHLFHQLVLFLFFVLALLTLLEAEILLFEQVDVSLKRFSMSGFFEYLFLQRVHLGR